MEAMVRSMTGLLPAHVQAVRLQSLDDGGWQALCEGDLGQPRRYRFGSGVEIQSTIASTLESDLGFTTYAANETARRLFEPFALAAEWRW